MWNVVSDGEPEPEPGRVWHSGSRSRARNDTNIEQFWLLFLYACFMHLIYSVYLKSMKSSQGLIRPINQSSCDQPTATSGGAPENQWMDTAKQSESSGEEDMSIEKAYKMWPFDAR